MNTHHKGQIAELKIQQRAVEKGFIVSKPISDSGRYDLIIDDGTAMKRVQVKYADSDAHHCNGAISLMLGKRRRDKDLRYSDKEIDLVLVYLPKKDAILCLTPDRFNNKAAIQIRIELPKNGQKTGINFYQDFIW